MAALPALSRNYSSRNNIPFGSNNTSEIIQDSFYTWALFSALTDKHTSGSLGGTRHANSVWITRGASNAASYSALTSAGTNNPTASALWGNGVFPGAFTRAANGTAHHWILLENTFLGRELLLNFSGTPGHITFAHGPIGCYGGGSLTNTPVPSPTVASLHLNQVAWEGSQSGHYSFFRDFANTGLTRFCHFTCADTGEFWFCSTRTGLGEIHNWLCLWKSADNHVSDTKNFFTLCSDPSNGLGGLNFSRLSTATFCASIQSNGSQKTAGGIVTGLAGGANSILNASADSLSGLYNTIRAEIFEVLPSVQKRGYLPDIYFSGVGPTAGSSIPSAASQQRIFAGGGIILPCTGSALTV